MQEIRLNRIYILFILNLSHHGAFSIFLGYDSNNIEYYLFFGEKYVGVREPEQR